MNSSILCNCIKSIILLFVLFLTFSEVTCEVVSEEVAKKLQETYCDIRCFNKVNCECSLSETELQFQNHTHQIQIDLLCHDETIITFRWSPNDTLTYVYEYSQNGDWIYCDATKDNFVVLEDLESDKEYKIKIWAVSAVDPSVYGPFFSESVMTLEESYYPLKVPSFKVIDWKLENGTSFNAVLEWTPAEDRLCIYEIMVHSEERYEQSHYVTKDIKSLFRTEILGFNSGENYTISISPKLSNSFISGPSKWMSVNTPNCLELYKSLDKCVPNPPDNVNVTEKISKFFKRGFPNVTFDIYVTWSMPQYIPDNYTVKIIAFENNHQQIIQKVSGEATSAVFYNLTITPHYYLEITLRSKAGSSEALTIDKMITIPPDMIAVTKPGESNNIFVILIVTCAINFSIVLGMCLLKVKQMKYNNIEKQVIVIDSIQGGEFKQLDAVNNPTCW